MKTYEFTFIVVSMGDDLEEALDNAYELLPQMEPVSHALLEIDGQPVPYVLNETI